MSATKKQTARQANPKSAKAATRPSHAEITAFRRRVFAFYARQGRKLPFRETTDPYAIAVSEFMLQQTQVSRVLPKYEQWLKLFPDWKALASATPLQVLRAWSGLGYNRRAVYLHALAKQVMTKFDGEFPKNELSLIGIPGLGPYTRRAILIFSFNAPLATIDTNIRRVLISSFHLDAKISATELQSLADQALPRRRAREWHYALMDYGALRLTAKKSGVRSLSRQSKFDGSIRQVRGAIVKILADGSGRSLLSLTRLTGFASGRIETALSGLLNEGMLVRRGKIYAISQK